MPFKSENLGFLFSLRLEQEMLDEVAVKDLDATVTKVLKNYYGKIEFVSSSCGTIRFRVTGRDLFKAEKDFGAFIAQLNNQWRQGDSRRMRERPIIGAQHVPEIAPNTMFVVGHMSKLGPQYNSPAEWKNSAMLQTADGMKEVPVKVLRAHAQLDDAQIPDAQDIAEMAYEAGVDEIVKREAAEALKSLPPLPSRKPAVSCEFPGDLMDDFKEGAVIPKLEPAPERKPQRPVEAPPVPQDRRSPKVFAQPKEAPEKPAEPPLAPMDEGQQAAFDQIMKEPGHAFLTGSAGTGKSHVTKHLLATGRVTSTATTARASLIVGGCTVDRLFAFSRDTWKCWNQSYLQKTMEKAKPIISIDEASMVGVSMSEPIYKAAKDHRKKLVLVGDLSQASPVKDTWLVNSQLFQEIVANRRFFKLTKSHRQSELDYLAALDDLRRGEPSDLVERIFKPCMVASEADADEQSTRLYATNAATESYNSSRLRALETIGAPVDVDTTFMDMRPRYKSDEKPFDEGFRQKACEEGSFAHHFTAKIGARVLMTRNDPEGTFVNGDAGTIVDIRFMDQTSAREAQPFNPFMGGQATPPVVDNFIVRLDRFDNDIVVGRMNAELKDGLGEPLYNLSGFPLRLGWAMSIHRAQGMTVDKAYVDVATILRMPGESRHGLLYVAMSRTKTLAGLKLGNWTRAASYCADIVKPYI